MTQIINPIDAKMKFVKSLTHHDKYFDNDNFLKPVKRRVIKLTIIEESDASQSTDNIVKDDNHVSKEEFQRLMYFLDPKESKAMSEIGAVPDWAKLALASSNPNTTRTTKYY